MPRLNYFSTSRMLLMAAIAVFSIGSEGQADEILSFQVDPDTFDSNMDGFIQNDEFQPFGSDGTRFILTPTENLVGGDRLLLSEDRGLHYGGGGGSTLAFDFTANRDIELESYTLSSSGFFLGNPSFNINEGTTVLSSSNTSNDSGNTHDFNGGPIALAANTTYSFETQVSGAGVQAYMSSWTYSVSAVPEPGTLSFLLLAGAFAGLRRRRHGLA